MELPQTRIIIGRMMQTSEHSSPSSSDCIPKQCHDIIISNNCSCSEKYTDNTCEADENIPRILWVFTGLVIAILFVELIALWFHRPFLKNIFGKMLFCIGLVLSVVTQLCTMPFVQEYGKETTLYYSLTLGVATVCFVIFGFFAFFELKSENNNIGSHDEGMGLVLIAITVLMSPLELTLIISSFPKSKILGAFVVIWFIEKILQIIIYILIRKRVHRAEYRDGAIFYFNILAFLNFTMWLSSIPFTGIQLYKDSENNKFWLVDRTYKALVIDYRLLCTLLFFEHALALSKNDKEPLPSEEDSDFPSNSKRKYFAIGVLLAIACCLFEIMSGIQFWVSVISYGINILPILVDVFLSCCGICLLRNVTGKYVHNENISLVTWMVLSFGLVTIVYLITFSLLCIVMSENRKYRDITEHHSYVIWSTFVFCFRAISLMVLLVVYTGVPFSVMTLPSNHNRKNYILTMALFGGIFARFIGSILDEFHGTMHNIAHTLLVPSSLRSLKDLFQIGPLFHLATCLHLSLHFLLMVIRLMKYPLKIAPKPEEPIDTDHNEQEMENDNGNSEDTTKLLNVA